jgi:hypothetical protein
LPALTVAVTPVNGERFDAAVAPGGTWGSVKAQVRDIKGIPVEKQKLIVEGKLVDDEGPVPVACAECPCAECGRKSIQVAAATLLVLP